jgi:hypothetical protein
MPARAASLFGLYILLHTLSAVPARGSDGAPSALHGKTVILAWSENRTSRKADNGQISQARVVSDFRVYVSDAGRLFTRFTRRNASNGRSNSSSMSPDGDTQSEGQGSSRLTTHFEGHQLVSENQMRSGARRIQAEFDNDFRSCTLRVIYGKESGALLYHRGMDGRMGYILANEVLSPRCSVTDGNHVASQ